MTKKKPPLINISLQLPEPEAVAVLHFAANRLQLAYQTYMVDDDLATPSEEPPTDRKKSNREANLANLQGLFAKLDLEEREVFAFLAQHPNEAFTTEQIVLRVKPGWSRRQIAAILSQPSRRAKIRLHVTNPKTSKSPATVTVSEEIAALILEVLEALQS